MRLQQNVGLFFPLNYRALGSHAFVDALLKRVLALWDYLPSVSVALSIGYFITYSGTAVSTIISLKTLYRELQGFGPPVSFNSGYPSSDSV